MNTLSDPPVIHCGNARFTILSPHCIRMEYEPGRRFVDEPSWFARSREAIPCAYTATEGDDHWTITTSAMRLSYRKPSRKFSSDNLTAEIHYGGGFVPWAFGMINTGNLGGTLQTLDGISRPVPLPEGLLSRDGWYCLDDSKTHLFVDGWIRPRPESAGSDHYLFAYGRDFPAALRSLTSVSGKIPLPRKCVLGSWYSRWHRYSDEDYRQIVREFDDHRIPLDIMVMDMDWHTKETATHGHGWAKMLGWTGWSWNRELFPDPEGLLRWFHEQGLRVTLNAHPHDGVREHEECYLAFMEELGADPSQPLPLRAGDKKYLDAYFKIPHGALEKQGVDFWWVDWQQDSIMPLVEDIPGMKHLPLLNDAYYRFSDRDPGRRGLGFSRWAGWGDQRYPIHFSGDAVSNWDMLAFEIYFTATAGNVGCFFWSHDIGGFYGERDPELFARWVQFGSMSAAMRLHSTGEKLDRRPWKWGDEVEESIRRSFSLRSRLMPYIYSQVHKSCEESVPLIRTLYLEDPESEESYHAPHEYHFGEAFLAAPVTTPNDTNGKARTTLWLPEGEWVHWFSGSRHVGRQFITVESDLNTFPLFVRAGYPVTLQPFTLRMASTKLDEMTVRIYGASGDVEQTAILYEDDGESRNLVGGECARTEIRWKQSGDEAELSLVPPHEWGRTWPRQRRVIIEADGCSSHATANGESLVGVAILEENLLRFDLGTHSPDAPLLIKFHVLRR